MRYALDSLADIKSTTVAPTTVALNNTNENIRIRTISV